MKRILVNHQSSARSHLKLAAEVIRQGGLVAFATDTVYGLTCDPRREEALKALFHLKQRPLTRRLPFVATDLPQAALLVSLADERVRALARRFWPGPLSLVLALVGRNRLAEFPWGDSLAIRVPGSTLSRGLAQEVGIPIPATSLNRWGEPAFSDPEQLPDFITRGIDLLLDAGQLSESRPSTIVDLTGPSPVLVREGAVRLDDLTPILGPFAGAVADS